MKRKIVAIMAADVAGYSRLVAEDEEETLRRLGAYREVFDDVVRRHGGRIFNTAGDSVMSEFDSAVEATRAAIDIQESLRTRNLAYAKGRRVEFRIGITIGDVVERDGDLLGDGVNTAARLQSLAEPGGICISRSVHEAVVNKTSVPFRDLGPRQVKNLPQPVHAFAAAWPSADAAVEPVRPQRRERSEPSRRGGMGRGLLTGFLVTLVVLAAIFIVVPTFRAVRRAIDPPTATAPAEKEPPQRADTKEKPQRPDEAARAYAALAKEGDLVAEARTAPELYHNARLLETRGDALGARRAYLALAALRRDFVDPHLRFAALLRVQDGRAGAREVYGQLTVAHPAKIVTLMHALQFDGADRRGKVEAFVAANPDVAPAHFLVAEEYSPDRLGPQTLSARRLEFEALERFLDAEANGRVSAFFLDRSVLAQWLDRARKRKAAIEAFFKTAATRPTASFARSAAGWTATLVMPEPAKAISYRVGETGEMRSTGTQPGADQGTGRPAPMATVDLPPDQERATIYVAYEDAAGRTAGPFAVNFDPHAALVANGRAILDVTSDSWLSFDRGRDSLLYFTHLVSYRCAIARAMVGFDGGPLDTALPLPPCDASNPYAVPADLRPSIAMPETVEKVSVQLTYVDGSQSPVKTLDVQ